MKNFLNGMGSILNLCPVSKPKILSDEEALQKDYEAIMSDWYVVGNDLRNVIGIAPEKTKKNLVFKFD